MPTVCSWKNNKNEFIGVWKEDWAYILGENLIKKFPEMTFEVLRVDERAEKIYEYSFSSGLMHKSFPPNYIRSWQGLKYKFAIYSYSMEDYLKSLCSKLNNKQYLLMLPAENTIFTLRFTKLFNSIMPIVHFHFTNNDELVTSIQNQKNYFKLSIVNFYLNKENH